MIVLAKAETKPQTSPHPFRHECESRDLQKEILTRTDETRISACVFLRVFCAGREAGKAQRRIENATTKQLLTHENLIFTFCLINEKSSVQINFKMDFFS